MNNRPSVTFDGDNVLKRTSKVSNRVNGTYTEISSVQPDFPLTGAQLAAKKAGPSVGTVASDISMGGLLPGTTSKNGGKMPYHTSGLRYKTLLQDQPVPAFTRKT